jgi:uncharacterized protein YdaU (DUF1376 family)
MPTPSDPVGPAPPDAAEMARRVEEGSNREKNEVEQQRNAFFATQSDLNPHKPCVTSPGNQHPDSFNEE